jgi:hypothetical protein
MTLPARSTVPPATVTDHGIRDLFGDTPNYLDFDQCVQNFLGSTGHRLEFNIKSLTGQEYFFWIWRDEEGKNFRLEISGHKFEPQQEVEPIDMADFLEAMSEFGNVDVITPDGVVTIRDGEVQD